MAARDLAERMSDRRRRSPIPALLAVLVGLGSVAGLARPDGALAWDGGAFSSTSERQLVTLTNRSRANAGLRALRVDRTLTAVARWRSKDMTQRDYFSHDIPGYGSVFRRLDAKGYCYRIAGENIGWNTYPDGDATAAIHSMFMDSSGHRRNVLGRRWDVIGVGAYKGADGKKMWTVLFADRCGASVAKSSPKPKPKATARPQAKPKPKATPRPTPKPTPRPTPTPSPTPTPMPTAPLVGLDLPPDEAVADARGDPATTDTGLRVLASPPPGGLVETIVGNVTGAFFGG